jgi:hypothetical protein
MAGTTGLEPATSAVTGQHSNQLNYVPAIELDGFSEINTPNGVCRFRVQRKSSPGCVKTWRLPHLPPMHPQQEILRWSQWDYSKEPEFRRPRQPNA